MKALRPAILALCLLGGSPHLPGTARASDDLDMKRAAELCSAAKRLEPSSAAKFKVLIDPGHTPGAPGAISSQGLPERGYNQGIASEVLRRLAAEPDLESWSTNGPGQDVANGERAKLANRLAVSLFLSVHHDSVQPVYLSTWTFNGVRRSYCDRFRGFSLHVATDRPASKKSLVFAKVLGEEMLRQGFTPTLHHAERIKGEGMKLLDKGLGIYERNELTVFTTNERPAVLLECGVLVNREEERSLQDPAVQARIVEAVIQAVRRFRAQKDAC